MGNRRTIAAAAIATTACLLLAACSGSSSKHDASSTTSSTRSTGSTSPTPAGPIGHAGRWLTEPDGRVVLLDGVNYVDKSGESPAGQGFGADDAQWLADNGIDAVRLGWSPGFLMPTPGKIDESYVDSFVKTVHQLTSRGILVLVDNHQDGWGPEVYGNGFPAWMTLTHGATNLERAFPLYYVTNPAIQAAFTSFWSNAKGPGGVGLQDQMAAMFRDVASKLKGDPGILGYDLINEPFPGPDWNPCENQKAGCAAQDHASLDAYYARMTKAIRSTGDHHIVFGEPFVLFNFGQSQTHIVPPAHDADAGMSFHMYTLSTSAEPAVVSYAEQWAKETGGALLASEFGATTGTAATDRQAKLFDHALIPWMFWAYQELMDDVAGPAGGKNVVASTARAVIRPHPVLVAGTPKSLDYDLAHRILRFRYSTTGPTGKAFPAGAVTSFDVAARTYPRGYKVAVEGGRVTSKPGALKLTVVADADAAVVSVTISG